MGRLGGRRVQDGEHVIFKKNKNKKKKENKILLGLFSLFFFWNSD